MQQHNPSQVEEYETCPLGYKVGSNGICAAWDAAIERGNWEEIKDTVIAINFRTIVRNAINAFNLDGPQVKLEDRIREDILLIKEYFQDVHNTSIHIYAINYDRLNIAKLPNYRVPKTDRQIEHHKYMTSMLEKCRDLIEKWYDTRIPFGGEYLVSHIIYDMLLVSSNVKLLETHSGAIKPQLALNSKLNLNDGEIQVIPFNKLTYALYGDKQLLNKNKKMCQPLLDILLKRQVTPLSSENRFTMALKLGNPLLHEHIRRLLP